MDNSYIKQFPDLMAGKTLLYVHGFASSGQSGTVQRMRIVMPSANIIAPDLPLPPQEALSLLRNICKEEQPDIIIGTSMGGMFAEMLYGYDRIIINPAFCIGDTMVQHNMVGAQQFQNSRQDGVQNFIVTKALIREYKEISQQCFSGVTDEERNSRVVGLFGDEDTLVDTRDLFLQHYRYAISFHGEHRMNDKSFMHSVVPVIRWIDDRQNNRMRPVVFVDINTLRDAYDKPTSSSQKAIRRLIETYRVFFVKPTPPEAKEMMTSVEAWMNQYVNVPAYQHIIYINDASLLYGDYFITSSSMDNLDSFIGTRIDFGSDTFKTWEEIITYFDRLNGQ